MFRMAECDGSVFRGNLCSVIPRTVYAAWPCGVLRRANCSLSTIVWKERRHSCPRHPHGEGNLRRVEKRCFASTSKTAPRMQALPTAGSGLTVELFGELAVICLGGVRPPHRTWTNPPYPRRIARANIQKGLFGYSLFYILFFEGDMQCLFIFAMMRLTIWLQRS